MQKPTRSVGSEIGRPRTAANKRGLMSCTNTNGGPELYPVAGTHRAAPLHRAYPLRPLPLLRLPVSAAGGGRLRSNSRTGHRVSALSQGLHIKKSTCLLRSRCFGDPYGNRTHVNGVRGRCLNHLTNGPWCTFTDSNRGPTD